MTPPVRAGACRKPNQLPRGRERSTPPGRWRLFFVGLFVFLAAAAMADTIGRQPTRSGPVHLEGRALADDGGAWNAFGASLFWALWAEAHAPDKLDANLATLATAGVDAVRILGMVGRQPTWVDRVIDPADPAYWPTVEALFDRLRQHGLRAQVTLFADAQVMMPSLAARQTYADRWREFATPHAGQITFLEVANEAWQNGFEDLDTVRALGARLARGPILVTLSAPPGAEATCALYAGSAADLVTLHHDRDVRRAPGVWRPHLQPWTYPTAFDTDCPGELPDAVANNEPIGPGSSIESDEDPGRLALGLATTYLSGHAVYTLHAGPGIQGGNGWAAERGRVADYGDLDPAMLDALGKTHRRLPPGLAGWDRQDPASAGQPWTGLEQAISGEALAGAPTATRDGNLVAALAGIAREFTLVATRDLSIRTYDPATGEAVESRELRAGDVWRVDNARDGLLVIGEPGLSQAR